MRSISVLSTAIVAIICLPVWATIINVPGDYGTIQEGINASQDGDTVLVQPGSYVENIDFNGHNIVLGSLFLTTEDTTYISETIIDGDSTGSVVTFQTGENNTAVITGFVIQNGLSDIMGGGISCVSSDPTITYNYIRENLAIGSQIKDAKGGGIYCFNSAANISNNTISQNRAIGYPTWTYGLGGGIYCYNSNASISHNLIDENYALGAWGLGGGLSLWFSSPRIINNVIVGNLALQSAGGIYCWSSNPLITNTIFWADSAQYSSEVWSDTSSALIIIYCDIQDTLWPGEGNISNDPLFRNAENRDFHLQDSIVCGDLSYSPCIDAGHPDLVDNLLDCNRGLGEARSDMGAYGGGEGYVGIHDHDNVLPEKVLLSQNYPNPFNARTTIQYALPEAGPVKIEICDLLGRKVETLSDTRQPAGSHQITWNAADVSSGIYFYKLQAGEYSEARKMILLK